MDPETGMRESQAFEVRCSICGQRWRGSCSSGRLREKAATFAASHVHRDPLATR